MLRFLLNKKYVILIFSALLMFSIILGIAIHASNYDEKYFNITEKGVVTLKPEYLNIEKISGRKRLTTEEQKQINEKAISLDLTTDEYLFLCFLKSNEVKDVFKKTEDAQNFLSKTLKMHNSTNFSDVYKNFKKSDKMWSFIIPIILSEDKTTELPNDIVIPEKINKITVTTIGYYGFAYTDIKNIELPDTIVCIEEAAFEGCVKLTTVNFPESIKDIKSTAFINCNNMETPIPKLKKTKEPA